MAYTETSTHRSIFIGAKKRKPLIGCRRVENMREKKVASEKGAKKNVNKLKFLAAGRSSIKLNVFVFKIWAVRVFFL